MTALTEEILLDAAEAGRAQYRGSDDALNWTGWSAVPDIRARYPWYPFVQVQILVAGEWLVSPIFTWDA